ncbi:MAG: D-alanine--D-alanine ligase [Deltaproteobacteria bacterium]|nr:D-alanine--D-alanine ligase [Deltaproteobacteria bacterium]
MKYDVSPTIEGMTVPIVYDEIIEAYCRQDETERIEIDWVSTALSRLGYRPLPLPVNLSVDKNVFTDLDSRVVFNCVDSLEESGRFVHIVPSILDEIGIPYTGSGADAIYLTSNKVLAKRFLKLHRIRTPRWCRVAQAAVGEIPFEPPYIVKHVWEDASFGIDEHSVLFRKSDLKDRATDIPAERRYDYFVEAFIEGREFNVSLIAGSDGPQVLPPMELEFHGFRDGRPKIVDYQTKWGNDQLTEARIDRRFDFTDGELPLIHDLEKMARDCWHLFRIGGYARIDFRVDGNGVPMILEINTNPYLGKDSSFLAAASRAGLDFDDVIRIVVNDALGHI